MDHVVSRVPVRQWVLTMPHRSRYRIGYDHELYKRWLRAFHTELQRCYRAESECSMGRSGSVTLIQRFDGGLPETTRAASILEDQRRFFQGS